MADLRRCFRRAAMPSALALGSELADAPLVAWAGRRREGKEGSSEEKEDRVSSMKVRDRWGPCFRRYAIDHGGFGLVLEEDADGDGDGGEVCSFRGGAKPTKEVDAESWPRSALRTPLRIWDDEGEEMESVSTVFFILSGSDGLMATLAYNPS